MGIKTAQRLLQARDCLPMVLCDDVAFDAWFLPLLLDSLEPVQRDVLEWLLVHIDGPVSTPQLCNIVEMSVNRAGAALSDLRMLGLISTTHHMDASGRIAFHAPVDWVQKAWDVVDERKVPA